MSTSKSVSGVLGMFWVGFGNPTQIKRPFFRGVQTCVLGVLGLASRARMRDVIYAG